MFVQYVPSHLAIRLTARIGAFVFHCESRNVLVKAPPAIRLDWLSNARLYTQLLNPAPTFVQVRETGFHLAM